MTDVIYQDARDHDLLRVRAGNDAVAFAHLRSDVAHTINLDPHSVAQLVYQLTAWLEGQQPTCGATCGPVPKCDGETYTCDLQPGHPLEHEDSETRAAWANLPASITALAEAAVYGDREADYGHPREDFTRQAILWTGLLNHKLADGEYIEAEDIARCMIAVKLARDVHSPKRDNRVDGVGYFLTLDRLETGR